MSKSYADILQETQAEHGTQGQIFDDSAEAPLRASMLEAQKTTPDHHAEVLHLSKRLMVDPDYVERHFDEIKAKDNLENNDYSRIMRETPRLGTWLMDPNNSKVASDDVQNLGVIDRLMDLGRSFLGGTVESTGSAIAGAGELAGVAGRFVQRNLPGLPSDLWEGFTTLGHSIEKVGAGIEPAAERQTFLTQLSSGLGQMIPVLAASIVGGPEAGTALFAAQNAESMAERAEKLGKPEDDFSILSGATIGAIAGRFGIGQLLERVPPQIANPFLRRFADVVLSGGSQAGLQAVQGLANNIATQLRLNPNQELTEGLYAQAVQGGAVGAVARAILGVAIPDLSNHFARMDRAQRTRAWLDAAGKAVQESNLYARLPSGLRDYIKSAKPTDNVYLPTEPALQYFQDNNLDPAEILGPEGAENLRRASENHEDTAVPVEEYLTRVAAREHARFFNDIARSDPESMNYQESLAYRKENYVPPTKEEVEDENARSAERVGEDIRGQLLGQGFSPDVVDSYARIYEYAFRAMAERSDTGQTPEQIYEKYKLKITRPLPEILRTLPDIDTRMDPLIDRLRAGKMPSLKEMYGQSLVDWLRSRGGVKDEGGDLASREPDKDLRPFQPRLINPDKGVPLDTAREAAAEAGYLDQNTSIADFLDLIDKELSGRPVYAQGAEVPEAIEQNVILQQLSNYLKSRDVDIQNTSNAEIKKLLKDAAEVPAIDGATGTLLAQDASRPIIVRLTGKELGETDDIKDLRKAAVDHYVRELQGRRVVRPGFGEVEFTGKGLDKFKSTSANRTKLRLLPAVPGVIERGQLDREVHLDKPRKDGVVAFYYFSGRVDLAGRPVVLDVTVLEDQAGRKFWNANTDADAEKARRRPKQTISGSEPSSEGGGTTLNQNISPDTGDVNLRATELDFDKRGMIHFGPNREMSISLLKSADLSTFLHETGHFYLEVFGDLVEDLRQRSADQLSPTQQRMVADYGKLLKWMGVENRAGIQTDQHEQFARGFEAYLREGKAPAPELRTIFARTKAWLKNIYRSLTQLNVDLTPEVREVFDRLLASDDQIQRAREDAQIRDMIASQGQAERLGMTREQYAIYGKTVQAARDAAQDELDSEYLEEYNRQSTEWYKARRREMREQVAAEVHGQRDYIVLSFLRTGKLPDGSELPEGYEAFKLDAAALEKMYDKYKDSSIMQALHKLDVYRRQGGVDPEDAARTFGYSSADEMIQAILKLRPQEDLIEAETDDRMKQTVGDILTDGTAPEKARDAVISEGRSRVIEAEMRALARKLREDEPIRRLGAREERQSERERRRAGMATIRRYLPSIGLARDIANGRLAEMKDRDIKPSVYFAAARSAGKAALEALNRGDYDEALRNKQNELVHVETYRAARDWQKERDGIVERMRSYDDPKKRGRIGKAGEEYLDQIDKLRERFEFSNKTNKALDRRQSLRDFIERQKAQGHPLTSIPEDLLNEAYKTNYREMTPEELRGLHDAVKSIEHWANFKNKLLRQQAQRDLQILTMEGEASLSANSRGEHKIGLEMRLPGSDRPRTKRSFFLAHLPMGSIIREMDGFHDGGFMFENIMRPIDEAGHAEAVRNEQATEAVTGLFRGAYRGEESSLWESTYIAEIKDSLTKWGRLMVALNWGNDGNRQRVKSGFGWSDSQVEAILATLDERDWKFVQSIWDHIHSYWQEISDKEQRVTGVRPEKVEAAPVQTKYGEFRGGYFPIAYETRASARASDLSKVTFADLISKASYNQASTARGHTQARSENVTMPLRLDPGVITEHLQQVIHDLTHHEMLIDVGRLLGKLGDGILRTHGDIALNEIKSRVQDIAIGSTPVPNWYRGYAAIRSKATAVRLGWNMITAMVHLPNITSGMVRVGPKWVLKGVLDSLSSAKGAENSAQWVAEQSDMMRLRWKHRMVELSEFRDEIGMNRSKLTAHIHDAAAKLGIPQDAGARFVDSYLYMIHRILQFAEIPTWVGAYQKAIAGGAEADSARAQADRAILDAIGGGQIKDQAAVQQGAIGKIFSTFMTYQLSMHRLGREVLFKKAGTMRKIVDGTLLVGLPIAFVTGVYHVARPRKDETLAGEFGGELMDHAVGMFVGIRELAGATRKPDYSGPAAFGVVGAMRKAVFRITQGEGAQHVWGTATARAINEASGEFFGYPAFQVERTIDGILDLYNHRSQNPAELLFGPPKP